MTPEPDPATRRAVPIDDPAVDAHDAVIAGTPPRWLRTAEPILGMALLGLAVWILWRELHEVRPADVVAAASALPRWQLGLALGATALNYAIATGYDHLALQQLGRKLGAWRASVAGFAAFAVVNNLGFALITGPWARLRFYARWGMDLSVLPQVVAVNAVTVWTGLFALLGGLLALEPDAALAAWAPLAVWRGVGIFMLCTVAAYLALAASPIEEARIARWTLRMPDAWLALRQIVLSALDWVLVACVLWLLMPARTLPFTTLFAAVLAAQLVGLISHVPGSLGVFEGTMLTMLHGDAPPHALLAGLLLFRIVYYFVPLVVALVAIGIAAVPNGSKRRHRQASE